MAVTKDKNAKENPWYFTIEINENGKRKRIKRRGFKRKQDAEDARRQLLNELEQGIDLDASKTLFKEILHDWLNGKNKIADRTKETYSWLIENHIIPALGETPIKELTPRQIEKQYIIWKKENKISGENIRKCHTIIKAALNKAVSWDALIKNPAVSVETPEAENKEMMYWTEEDAHRFLNAAKEDRYYHAFLLAITTGMRQGEILGLQISDVDIKNRSVSVKQILDHSGKQIISRTKTKSGTRMIGIDKITANEIEKLVLRTKEEKMENRDIYNDIGLLICTKLGTPLSPRNLNRSFARLVDKVNENLKENEEPLKKIRFHDLRHTHVVMLLKMRENNKRIAERMGWSSVKMLDKYAHITPHMQEETADAFGEMFYSAPNGTNDTLVK